MALSVVRSRDKEKRHAGRGNTRERKTKRGRILKEALVGETGKEREERDFRGGTGGWAERRRTYRDDARKRELGRGDGEGVARRTGKPKLNRECTKGKRIDPPLPATPVTSHSHCAPPTIAVVSIAPFRRILYYCQLLPSLHLEQ